MNWHTLRSLAALTAFLLLIPPIALSDSTPKTLMDASGFQDFLDRFVRDGRVCYEHARQADARLDDYFARAQKVSPKQIEALNREEQIALWINLFNAAVVRRILESGVRDQISNPDDFYGASSVRLSDSVVSIADIRDRYLRAQFHDPRVLFALYTGRVDGPGLRPKIFQAETLEGDLTGAARAFIEDSRKNRIIPREKKIELAPVFREYASDFVLNYGDVRAQTKTSSEEAAVISFLIDYLQVPEKRIFLAEGSGRVRYLPEDFRLEIGAC